MSYEVHLSQRSFKFIEKLNKVQGDRIVEKLKELANDPYPTDSKFITRHEGDKVFRIRIGDWRALYKIKEDDKIVLITKIDKRPRVYHR